MATKTEVRFARRALPWPLMACLLAGCPTGQDIHAGQEALREELEMLRARLARLEADTAEQHRKIQRLTDLEEELAKKIEPVPPEEAAPGRPADPAESSTDAAPETAAAAAARAAETGEKGERDPPDPPDPPDARDERPTVAANEFTRRVQQALGRAGYDPGPIDGRAGAKTKRAIREFQRDNNLPETGVADEATWDLLKRYRE